MGQGVENCPTNVYAYAYAFAHAQVQVLLLPIMLKKRNDRSEYVLTGPLALPRVWIAAKYARRRQAGAIPWHLMPKLDYGFRARMCISNSARVGGDQRASGFSRHPSAAGSR